MKEKICMVKEKIMSAKAKTVAGVGMALSTVGLGFCDANSALKGVVNMVFNIAKAGGAVLALAGIGLVVKSALPSEEGGSNVGGITKGLGLFVVGLVAFFAKELLNSLGINVDSISLT